MHEELEKQVRNDLYRFYNEFVAKHYNDTVYASHIDDLSKELMLLKQGVYQRLCVAMPPRHSKSSLVSLAYPLWLIYQNPDLDILIVNSSASLSENFGIQLREYFQRYSTYFGVYLSDVKHSSTHLKFMTKEGELFNGSIRLVGAGGTITGTNADYLIIDDPYTGFDDITPTLLEKKINWFNNIILQRLEPESRLIILHTRWAENDLQGYLKQNHPDKYKFISYPAILPDGTSLWKERYPIKLLEQQRREMGERLFSAIYQQKPLDETSDYFQTNNITYVDSYNTEDIQYSVRAWDIANGENSTNDYTAGTKLHQLKDGTYLLTDIVHGQYGGNNLEIIKNTAQTDTPNTIILIETGVAAAGKLLYHEWNQQLNGYYVEQALPIKSKVDRATPLQNLILDKGLKVCLNDNKTREAFMKEFRAFPDGLHDDIVDSVAHAYNYLKDNMATDTPLSINI